LDDRYMHTCLLEPRAHWNAVETYRIKGLGRNRVAAGGFMLQ